MRRILAIDQGTTGTTALVVDENLQCMAKATVEFRQHFPQPGWVEHDTDDIWTSVCDAVALAVEQAGNPDIDAIGITNQRETVCFWDRATGKSLRRAIVWQDRRTADLCVSLNKKGHEPSIRKKTGLLLDPYFSGTKVAWALKNDPAVKAAHANERLAVGTIDSWLLNKLTDGVEHATEPSNASRTLCFALDGSAFDPVLCNLLGIPADIWPEVRDSAGHFGVTRGVPGLPDGIPITGMLGDQQAALLGQACTEAGMAKCTYGTGAFLLMHSGTRPVPSKNKLLTTVAWRMHGKTAYALEGSTFVAGAAVRWLRDGLGIIKKVSDVEALAKSVPDSGGVTMVPAFTGLGAPHWNPHARGSISGITRGTTAAHIARATLEGIALQVSDVLAAMHKDLRKPLKSLNVDGGASMNALLMQIQADLLGVPLRRPEFTETTALGAVFAAGLGAGFWTSMDDIRKSWKPDREFRPKMTPAKRKAMIASWKETVGKA